MKNRIITQLNIISLALLLVSCGASYKTQTEVVRQPSIYPDYNDVTIPRTIAPLNFTANEGEGEYIFDFSSSEGKKLFSVKSKNADCQIPAKKWQKVIMDSSNSFISLNISKIVDGVKYVYFPMKINISDDPIDSHLVYRLTNPGYIYWGEMGMYERELSSFEERPIIESSDLNQGCMNCHTFHQHSPDRFLFHLRQEYPGTVISIDGKTERFGMKTGSMISPTAYPSWHPDGRYVAFSTNITRQVMHATGDKVIEVFDSNSDIVIYDTQTNKIFSHEHLYNPNMAESFPSWSNDGKHLYFVSTTHNDSMFVSPIDLKYNLYRVEFDSENESFSGYELMFDAASLDMSVAIPRTFHDDTKVSFSMSNYGTFSIWHKESDLYSIDVNTRQVENLEILNSDESDSFRCHSSNDNWVVYTSRRDNGLYTNLYIAHYDKQRGEFDKPFMLPQESAHHNDFNERSYNVPEFITGAINKEVLKDMLKSDPIPVESGKGI